ncbi:hypothetical protein [Pseudomonas sp. LT1P18]|uniref:hypothetical protein n=1 Tax=Pseudomonas arabinosi TaxID=3398357 RepID=UPI0039F034BC
MNPKLTVLLLREPPVPTENVLPSFTTTFDCDVVRQSIWSQLAAIAEAGTQPSINNAPDTETGENRTPNVNMIIRRLQEIEAQILRRRGGWVTRVFPNFLWEASYTQALMLVRMLS